MRAATILIPTHNHALTLWHSVQSALDQSEGDLEILIVGDGADAATRLVAREIASRDIRVSYHDFPKSPRTGEAYRHQLLQAAQGEIVCYLSDDDLYLPDHVERMRACLREADFAHATHLCAHPDGNYVPRVIDLRHAEHQHLIRAIDNRIPLSCGAHTLAAYRQLPEGWTSTPHGTPTDLYMWRKFLAAPQVRYAAEMRASVVVFPSPFRLEWTNERRTAELAEWRRRLADPTARAEIFRDAAASFLSAAVDHEVLANQRDRARLAEIEQLQLEASQQAEVFNAHQARLAEQQTQQAAVIAAQQARLDRQQARIARLELQASLKYRLATFVRSLPTRAYSLFTRSGNRPAGRQAGSKS